MAASESGKYSAILNEANTISTVHNFNCMKPFNILWHTGPLTGNDCESNDKTMGAIRQEPAHDNESTVGNCVFCVVHSEAI
jgi:hypothetical protein